MDIEFVALRAADVCLNRTARNKHRGLDQEKGRGNKDGDASLRPPRGGISSQRVRNLCAWESMSLGKSVWFAPVGFLEEQNVFGEQAFTNVGLFARGESRMVIPKPRTVPGVENNRGTFIDRLNFSGKLCEGSIGAQVLPAGTGRNRDTMNERKEGGGRAKAGEGKGRIGRREGSTKGGQGKLPSP